MHTDQSKHLHIQVNLSLSYIWNNTSLRFQPGADGQLNSDKKKKKKWIGKVSKKISEKIDKILKWREVVFIGII